MTGEIHIMGIVNLTPDSFFAGSRRQGADAVAQARQMLTDGADVIDFGACSTRPGSAQPTLEEEWSRLEPVMRLISEGEGDVFRRQIRRPIPPENASLPLPLSGGGQVPGAAYPAISIDTYRAEIVRRAFEIIGPFLVNDISGGEMDPQMLETVGRLGLPYVAMHMRGTPETMQSLTDYPDVLEEVKGYFGRFAQKAEAAGIRDWILDPGFGFSKTIGQNYQLLERMAELQALGRPILVGLSRKSMVYKVLGITPEEAMPATQVVQWAALERGATWLRVHDVVPAVQTARLYSTMYTSSPGAAK